MKNAKQLLPVIAVLLFVSLSCGFLRDKLSDLGSGSVKVASIPPFDPDGPMVSPGAYVIRLMAKDEPPLAALAEEVDTAERKMMKQIIDENRPKTQTDSTQKSFIDRPPERTKAIAKSEERPVAAHLMFQSSELALPTIGDGAVFGGFTGHLKGMLASALTNETFNKKETKTEQVEGGTSKMNVEIGVNPDGSSVFEIGIVTETEKNGIKARTELKARIEGQDCPNTEGQVPITIKMRLAGQSGSSRYEQDVTAFVRVVVDDNAEIASQTIEITQATARGRNGKNVFVETGGTYRRDPGQSESTYSKGRLIRNSDGATPEDVTDAINSGVSVAIGAASAAIAASKSAWQAGACIKIEAKSPGTVEVNSSTSIPVKVLHKKDGSEVAAKLDAELEGGASIDPTLMPKTPGTLMYVAPGETGKTATLKLKATSRRGIAKLDLMVNTGSNAYRIAGGLDDWYTNTVVCDITKPFTLTGGGFTMSFSGGDSGTYSYTGPFNAKGTGTYEISFPNGREKSGEMVGRGDGTIKGDKIYEGSGTENYSLYKVEGPCVDGPVQE
ncbi:MAG TPA: hypothetical protein PKD24_11885 [Pyrinomonadaceae bacterium]|nr:hypothetical protein [Pyrinomonadaceae bacterium]HMP65948.1 hypothetical protein [Pyrinomonadaceae bacterium]